MKNDESKEMYLETLLKLKNKGARCRAVDVATEMGFSRPSVSNAVKLLQTEGLIYVNAADGELEFTAEGKKRAENVFDRHCVLTALFASMGAGDDLAEENACRVEHVLSDEMFDLIKRHVSKN